MRSCWWRERERKSVINGASTQISSSNTQASVAGNGQLLTYVGDASFVLPEGPNRAVTFPGAVDLVLSIEASFAPAEGMFAPTPLCLNRNLLMHDALLYTNGEVLNALVENAFEGRRVCYSFSLLSGHCLSLRVSAANSNPARVATYDHVNGVVWGYDPSPGQHVVYRWRVPGELPSSDNALVYAALGSTSQAPKAVGVWLLARVGQWCTNALEVSRIRAFEEVITVDQDAVPACCVQPVPAVVDSLCQLLKSYCSVEDEFAPAAVTKALGEADNCAAVISVLRIILCNVVYFTQDLARQLNDPKQTATCLALRQCLQTLFSFAACLTGTLDSPHVVEVYNLAIDALLCGLDLLFSSAEQRLGLMAAVLSAHGVEISSTIEGASVAIPDRELLLRMPRLLQRLTMRFAEIRGSCGLFVFPRETNVVEDKVAHIGNVLVRTILPFASCANCLMSCADTHECAYRPHQ